LVGSWEKGLLRDCAGTALVVGYDHDDGNSMANRGLHIHRAQSEAHITANGDNQSIRLSNLRA